ncbi:urease accessory protein UreD [Stella sp.]|uniref:urease accessory protein UreD n=1 Tax=Stella sp. TaxID=2912054 RepID=UPI0035B2F0D3
MRSAPLPSTALPTRLQRSDGRGRLRFVTAGGRTQPTGLFQSDPVRFLFPLPERGEPLPAILVTTSGGLAGGDRIRLDLAAEAGSVATVATQAAEKVYRSAGEDTRFAVAVRVARGAWFEWLPQEAILFDGARLVRTTEVDVDAGGRLLALEMLVFGRRARGEVLATGMLRDDWRVRIDGRLAWADALRLTEPLAAAFAARAGLDGAAAMATLLLVGEGGAAARDAVRAVADERPEVRIGASVVGPVMVARFLGRDARALRDAVLAAAGRVRNRLAGLPERLPELWYG